MSATFKKHNFDPLFFTVCYSEITMEPREIVCYLSAIFETIICKTLNYLNPIRREQLNKHKLWKLMLIIFNEHFLTSHAWLHFYKYKNDIELIRWYLS